MMKESAAIGPEDIQAATQLALESLAYVLLDSESTPEDHLRHLGDFMICCALSDEDPSAAPARERLATGLEIAGVDADVTALITEKTRKLEMRRLVFSLAYIPRDETVPGIIETRTGRTIDEAKFIRGMLEKRKEARQ